MPLPNRVPLFFIGAALLIAIQPPLALAQPDGLALTIASPAPDQNSSIFTRQAPLQLQGAARGAAGIVKVTWESFYGFGDSATVEPDGFLSLNAHWKTGPIGLRPGANWIKVTALDRSNREAVSHVTVYYAPDNPAPPPAGQIRTSFYNGREVTYHVVNGRAIYQGDIILGTAAELERAQAPGLIGMSTPGGKNNAAAGPLHRFRADAGRPGGSRQP